MDTLTLQEREDLLKEYRKKEKTYTTWYKTCLSFLIVFIILTLLSKLLEYNSMFIVFLIISCLLLIAVIVGIIFCIIAHNNAKFLDQSVRELIIENEMKSNPYFKANHKQ